MRTKAASGLGLHVFPSKFRRRLNLCKLILADVGSDREEGASSLKIVDDFIATREKQLLDSQIVTFNLKELPINRGGRMIHP